MRVKPTCARENCDERRRHKDRADQIEHDEIVQVDQPGHHVVVADDKVPAKEHPADSAEDGPVCGAVPPPFRIRSRESAHEKRRQERQSEDREFRRDVMRHAKVRNKHQRRQPGGKSRGRAPARDQQEAERNLQHLQNPQHAVGLPLKQQCVRQIGSGRMDRESSGAGQSCDETETPPPWIVTEHYNTGDDGQCERDGDVAPDPSSSTGIGIVVPDREPNQLMPVGVHVAKNIRGRGGCRHQQHRKRKGGADDRPGERAQRQESAGDETGPDQRPAEGHQRVHKQPKRK